MIGVYVVWKKVKNRVISTPTWYVVCEINNKTCLNKWKCHKVDITVIFSIFFYWVRLLVGSRLKNKPQTAHWTTFYEEWKVYNQENTTMSHPLSVLPRWKKKKCDL